MRILFISASPLQNEISIGNTFLNLFNCEDDVELASVCTRSGVPDTPVSQCFCITEKMIIKSMLKHTPVGEIVAPKEELQVNCSQKTRSRILEFIRHRRWTIFFWAQDAVWKIGKWKNKSINDFVRNFNPDVIFTVLSNSVYLNNLILHVHSLTKAKLVLYAWDNNYSMKRFMLSPLRWIKHFVDRASMRDLASKADLFYVISDIQRDDYETSFHKQCKVLTKGADFYETPLFKENHNEPLQLVFTGNVRLNRWKSLKLIADALENINQDGIKAQLRIYTATPLTSKMEKALNRGDSSFLMGSVPASKVAGIQERADMLVHVEALDLKSKLAVRQSFSTKIVDYLKSARPILAVGPQDVASIDHLIRNDCAIVADNRKELEDKLQEVLADKFILRKIAENGYECGRKQHNKKDIQAMLMNDLNAICNN